MGILSEAPRAQVGGGVSGAARHDTFNTLFFVILFFFFIYRRR